jgi:hypothetical protein
MASASRSRWQAPVTWMRVVLPPWWSVILFAVGLVACELLAHWAMRGFEGWGVVNWDDVQSREFAWLVHRPRDGWLAAGVIAYGLYRVMAMHPFYRPAYAEWLSQTPWHGRLPLALGAGVPRSAGWLDLSVALVGVTRPFETGIPRVGCVVSASLPGCIHRASASHGRDCPRVFDGQWARGGGVAGVPLAGCHAGADRIVLCRLARFADLAQWLCLERGADVVGASASDAESQKGFPSTAQSDWLPAGATQPETRIHGNILARSAAHLVVGGRLGSMP